MPAFYAQKTDLIVFLPRDIIARPDMDMVLAYTHASILYLGDDRVGL